MCVSLVNYIDKSHFPILLRVKQQIIKRRVAVCVYNAVVFEKKVHENDGNHLCKNKMENNFVRSKYSLIFRHIFALLKFKGYSGELEIEHGIVSGRDIILRQFNLYEGNNKFLPLNDS